MLNPIKNTFCLFAQCLTIEHGAMRIITTRFIYFLVVAALLMVSSPVFSEYGDIIMNQKADSMRRADVDDVVFPHWFHRIRYRCNVCHESIFKLKAGSNDINMEKIGEKKQMCGKCHNGLIAWDVVECERCHFMEPGWTAGPIQHSTKNDETGKPYRGKQAKVYAKFMQIASGWHPVALTKSGLPLDKYGLVDWAGAVREKIVDPAASLEPGGENKTRDTRILFESRSSFISNIIFPHDIHSYWLECDICHKTQDGEIFKDVAGGNAVSMLGITKGKWCARCHNSVSFPISDCNRCHTVGKNETVESDVIIRNH